MNLALRRSSMIFCVGWPALSSPQCLAGDSYGEFRIGWSKNGLDIINTCGLTIGRGIQNPRHPNEPLFPPLVGCAKQPVARSIRNCFQRGACRRLVRRPLLRKSFSPKRQSESSCHQVRISSLWTARRRCRSIPSDQTVRFTIVSGGSIRRARWPSEQLSRHGAGKMVSTST